MKQTVWIDIDGYWLRDEPVEDDHTPKSDRQVDIKKYPIPPSLNYPRFINNKWEEGSTKKSFPGTSLQILPAPNWPLLKAGMQPFYQKYAASINLSASMAFYMAAVNSEINSPYPNIDILKANMIEWAKALSIRFDNKDKAQINQLLVQTGLDFQL